MTLYHGHKLFSNRGLNDNPAPYRVAGCVANDDFFSDKLATTIDNLCNVLFIFEIFYRHFGDISRHFLKSLATAKHFSDIICRHSVYTEKFSTALSCIAAWQFHNIQNTWPLKLGGFLHALIKFDYFSTKSALAQPVCLFTCG